MPFLDNREPAVYVDVQDNSLVVRTSEVGRTILSAFVSPRGQHRRVIDITGGAAQLHQEFGIPDLTQTNLAYYEFSNAIAGGARGLAVRVTPDDASLANVIIKKNTSPLNNIGLDTDFTFVEDNSYIDVDTTNFPLLVGDDSPLKLKIGDWIYSNDGVDTSNDIRQIVSIDDVNFKLILDSNYTGSVSGWTSKQSGIFKFVKYIDSEENASWDTKYTQATDLADPNNTIFQFIAKGAGAYYNKLKLKGVRNTTLEKLYVDSDGEPIYKYLFLDLSLYEERDNGQDSILEGPWTVSLVNTLDDGRVIVSLEGNQLYIEDVINSNSEYITCQSGYALGELMTSSLPREETERNRKLVSLLLSAGTPTGTGLFVQAGNALNFRNGADGTSEGNPLYDKVTGKVNIGQDLLGLVKQAYDGTLKSYDSSVNLLKENVYPKYNPDYVSVGGYPAWVAVGGYQFAVDRGDVLCIASLGNNSSFSKDIKDRQDNFAWNHRNGMLYGQWRRRRDEYTGKVVTVPPSFHALRKHIEIDAEYFIHEPVANFVKGAIAEPIELAYEPNHTERGDLQDKQINFTIKEPDGVYFLTQLTTLKQLSSLQRANNVKFIHYMMKQLPPLYKDILQKKASPNIMNRIQAITDAFMSKFRNSPSDRYNILSSYQTNVQFDNVAYEANIYIDITFIGVIERITVYIINH